MQAKTFMVIFGILFLLVNLVATLISFNITGSFLGFMPANPVIYTIANAVLSILMLVVALGRQMY